jgi:hypothetical protein
VRLLDEVEHPFSGLEVGDHPVLHRLMAVMPPGVLHVLRRIKPPDPPLILAMLTIDGSDDDPSPRARRTFAAEVDACVRKNGEERSKHDALG